MEKFQVALVDDHKIVRYGIKLMLEMENIAVVGEASTGAEAAEMFKQCSPDLAILDIQLPDSSGLDVARALRKDYPSVKILFVTMFDIAQYMDELSSLGVEGYIPKTAPPKELLSAVQRILNGGRFFDFTPSK
jgi:DNA-binding NarL/FixJ family response regulator